MCFYTTNLQCKVAKRDIIVYKIISYNNYSEIRLFKYIKNKSNRRICLNPIIETDVNNKLCYTINEGYHSYRNIKICLKEISHYISSSINLINRIIKISEFVIPKGTKYYKNKYTIVSERIIYKSDISLRRIKLFHYGLYRKIKSR